MYEMTSLLAQHGLVLVFAIRLDLVAPTGYEQFADSPTGWLSSILLPVIALSIGAIAGVGAWWAADQNRWGWSFILGALTLVFAVVAISTAFARNDHTVPPGSRSTTLRPSCCMLATTFGCRWNRTTKGRGSGASTLSSPRMSSPLSAM